MSNESPQRSDVNPPAQTNDLLRPAETAKKLLTTVGTLAKWRVFGCGPPYLNIGPKNIAYRVKELEEWLNGRIRISTSEGENVGQAKPKIKAYVKK